MSSTMPPPQPPSQQPPYGAGSPPVYPPLPARKPRPSGWWFVLGGGLLLAAVAVGIALFVWTLHGFLQVDSTIRADDRAHLVLVEPHEQKMLWAHDGEPARCDVTDRATGRPVAFTDAGARFTRSTGPESWVGVSRFDSGSGQLEVTCAAAAGPAQIGPAPQLGSFVGGIFATILIPLVLGLIGLLVLIVTGVRFGTGAPRTKGGNPPA